MLCFSNLIIKCEGDANSVDNLEQVRIWLEAIDELILVFKATHEEIILHFH